ncbi:MAG TPA: PEP-CTERM sorting domain-containing protein [Candidatus Limnocylindrales bacterium]|nr:PEP-CTERM sorting domain-containing protein [Candidatus Limnocylindrales bacterium]
MWFERAILRVSAAAMLFCAGAYANEVISNGNFSAGLTGWTVFTTPNGTNGTGEPTVATFTPVSSPAETAVQFDVGQATGGSMDFEGGGLSQTVNLAAGMLNVSVGIGAQGGTSFNLFGGIAELLIDSQPVAGYNFGSLQAGQVVSSTLTYDALVADGPHTLAIEFLRPATSDNTTPSQYAYDFSADEFSDVPEPSSAGFFLLGIAGLAGYYKAMRGRTHLGRSARPRVI